MKELKLCPRGTALSSTRRGYAASPGHRSLGSETDARFPPAVVCKYFFHPGLFSGSFSAPLFRREEVKRSSQKCLQSPPRSAAKLSGNVYEEKFWPWPLAFLTTVIITPIDFAGGMIERWRQSRQQGSQLEKKSDNRPQLITCLTDSTQPSIDLCVGGFFLARAYVNPAGVRLSVCVCMGYTVQHCGCVYVYILLFIILLGARCCPSISFSKT